MDMISQATPSEVKIEEVSDLQIYLQIPSFQNTLPNQKYNQKQRVSSLDEDKQNNKARNFLLPLSGQKLPESIKVQISKKITDVKNKILYPDLMGPHELYTFQFGIKGECLDKGFSVDLIEHLRSWLQNWVGKQKNQNLSNQESLSQNQDRNDENQISEATKNRRKRNSRYNKYSLAFKLSLVKKIRELTAQAEEGKSLRHYVVREARKLKIHPKNITRWLEISDLEKKQGGRKAKFPLLEQRLARFIEKNPNCKRKIILQEARAILSDIGSDIADKQNFIFSKGWFERFKLRLKRHKIGNSEGLSQAKLCKIEEPDV